MTESASIPPANGTSYRWKLTVNAVTTLGLAALSVLAWRVGGHEIALILGGVAGVYRLPRVG